MVHEKWMKLAIDEAKQSGDDVPIGAVIVKDGKIVSAAHNEREKLDSPTAHAEMLAIEYAAQKLGTRRLTDCTLYVTLEPCPMCAGAIMLSGIDTLVFGAFDEQYGCCGSLYCLPEDPAFSTNVKVIGGVLEKECAKLLDDFFSKKRLI